MDVHHLSLKAHKVIIFVNKKNPDGTLDLFLWGLLGCRRSLLFDDLLLLGGGSCYFRFSWWQWFSSFHGLAIENSTLWCGLLELVKDWLNHAILRALHTANLEAFEISQIWTQSLCLCTLSPQCRWPFFLQFVVLESLFDNTCWSCEGEFDDKLCQM